MVCVLTIAVTMDCTHFSHYLRTLLRPSNGLTDCWKKPFHSVAACNLHTNVRQLKKVLLPLYIRADAKKYNRCRGKNCLILILLLPLHDYHLSTPYARPPIKHYKANGLTINKDTLLGLVLWLWYLINRVIG